MDAGHAAPVPGTAVVAPAPAPTAAGYPVAHCLPWPARRRGCAARRRSQPRTRPPASEYSTTADDQEMITEMGQALVVGHQSDFPSVVAVRDGGPGGKRAQDQGWLRCCPGRNGPGAGPGR